jgi:DNA-binding response OmpR family regulator
MEDFNSKKVLIMDDDDIIMELLRINLETKGFKVIPAFNGEDGLKILYSEIPDIVIIDVCLPGLNGWQIYKKIKTDRRVKNIPVIILSGTREKELKKRYENPCIFFDKPFDPEDLIKTIEGML